MKTIGKTISDKEYEHVLNPLTVANGNIRSECATLVVTNISVLKTNTIWKHQNRNFHHHKREHCTLGTDISVCNRLDLLQRNEQMNNFYDVANRKIIDILRKKLVYVLVLIINFTFKGLRFGINLK